MPVDAVILGLHGAMVAQGYDDCEGDILERARKLAGDKAFIAAELDPHSNLTGLMLAKSDLMVHFKEFPHSDFYEQAERLADLSLRALKGEINPVMSAFDCRMIDVFPTSREPARGFVDRIKSLEGKNRVLSISFVHGFLAGDVPELGSKILVVTDGDKDGGDALAEKLGMEVFSMRGRSQPDYLTPRQAIDQAPGGCGPPGGHRRCVDNPGGGVAGDSTIILSELMAMGVNDAALATIWDPMAVRLCMAAGEGARLSCVSGPRSVQRPAAHRPGSADQKSGPQRRAEFWRQRGAYGGFGPDRLRWYRGGAEHGAQPDLWSGCVQQSWGGPPC